jgi:enoyl-CoA hydratase/carnithine racemase
MGVINRAVPRAELDSAVDQLAADIASSGPLAVRMCKRSIYRGTEHTLEDMIEYEALNQAATFRTADAREGVRAIMEKRAPKFTGS